MYLHNSSSDMVKNFFTALALIAENRDISYVDNDILSQEAAIFASAYLRRGGICESQLNFSIISLLSENGSRWSQSNSKCNS